MRNSFYTNRRKLIDKKSSDLPDLGITAESKVYISESLTRYKKELFDEGNKLRKKRSDGNISGLRTAESMLKNQISRQ